MTEIDSAAFEAGEASCNFSQDNVSASGSSTAAHFSATLGRVYVTARARLLSARPQAGHTQPALALVVEDSADGSSWATVATFYFTASDQQSAAVDSPRAYLRASWADVVGTWAVDVAVKSIASPASGGGSMPLHSTSVVLTDAEIKALPSTGQTIIAEPGGGKLVILQTTFLRMSPVDYVNYSNINPIAALRLQFTRIASEDPQADVSNIFANTTSGDAILTTIQEVHGTDVASAHTAASAGWDDGSLAAEVMLDLVDNGGDLTGGDPGNSLQVAVTYLLFDPATGSFV